MKNVILIAAPAAGKGTLAKMLVEKYNYEHISTGDLLRAETKKGTDLGNQISDMLKTGKLVPDEIVFGLLEKELKGDNSYILDGFPRNKEQALKYEELLKRLNKDLGIVIVINTDYETLKKRIVGRMLCSNCGRIYNTLTGVNKPKVENICDVCGSNLYKRSDDNEESFKIRYETYLEQTEPLIEYYKNKNILYYINSDSKEKMLEEVEVLLND